jgi:cell division transport system permease protein
MSLSSLEFLIREAAVNIRRNGVTTLATISTVTISLAVLGAFFVSLFAVRQFAGSLTERLEIAVFLDKGTSEDARVELQDKIEGMPFVTECLFISKESAWPEFKKQLGFKSSDDLGGLENPLVDAFRVKVSDPRQIIPTSDRIRRLDHIDMVREWATATKRLVAISDWIKLGGIAAGILLTIAMLAVIGNTLKLTMFSRRKEISIMQLVGATDSFIRVPFVLEGAFHGTLGGLAATAIVWGSYHYACRSIAKLAPFLERFYAGLPALALLVGLVGFGLVIGLGGTYLSMRSFLAEGQAT